MQDEVFAKIIDEKCTEVYNNAKEKGWWDQPDRNIGELIALMHSELSEALEAARTGKKDDHLPHIDAVPVELADCIIRAFDLCGAKNYPLGQAITEKIAYNKKRPHKHGKLF